MTRSLLVWLLIMLLLPVIAWAVVRGGDNLEKFR